MKRIEPINKPLRGAIAVPGDKSIAHRAVIFSAVAQGRSRILNLSGGDDNSRTVRAFRQMGVEIFRDGDALCVEGKGWDALRAPAETIDCPHHHDVELSTSGPLPQRIERWPLLTSFGTADTVVDVLLDDLPAIPFSDLPEFSDLVVRSLPIG